MCTDDITEGSTDLQSPLAGAPSAGVRLQEGRHATARPSGPLALQPFQQAAHGYAPAAAERCPQIAKQQTSGVRRWAMLMELLSLLPWGFFRLPLPPIRLGRKGPPRQFLRPPFGPAHNRASVMITEVSPRSAESAWQVGWGGRKGGGNLISHVKRSTSRHFCVCGYHQAFPLVTNFATTNILVSPLHRRGGIIRRK